MRISEERGSRRIENSQFTFNGQGSEAGRSIGRPICRADAPHYIHLASHEAEPRTINAVGRPEEERLRKAVPCRVVAVSNITQTPLASIQRGQDGGLASGSRSIIRSEIIRRDLFAVPKRHSAKDSLERFDTRYAKPGSRLRTVHVATMGF